MAKRLVMVPCDWPVTLEECPPGHFIFDGEYIGFKSEYHNTNGQIEAFNEAGESFSVGSGSETERDQFVVQPVTPRWEEYER